MGIPLSYKIITEKHNGTLECISKPGAGATFIIKIPQNVETRFIASPIYRVSTHAH